MLQLRKWLTARHDWMETCLQQLAALDGYGDLPRPLVQLFAHIGREPVRLSELARLLGTSRQWVLRLAHQGREMGMLILDTDPGDKRAMTVAFSDAGWRVVRLAVARMAEIEDELARRIGRERLAELVAILAMDWGPAEMPTAVRPRRAPRTAGRRAARR